MLYTDGRKFPDVKGKGNKNPILLPYPFVPGFYTRRCIVALGSDSATQKKKKCFPVNSLMVGKGSTLKRSWMRRNGDDQRVMVVSEV